MIYSIKDPIIHYMIPHLSLSDICNFTMVNRILIDDRQIWSFLMKRDFGRDGSKKEYKIAYMRTNYRLILSKPSKNLEYYLKSGIIPIIGDLKYVKTGKDLDLLFKYGLRIRRPLKVGDIDMMTFKKTMVEVYRKNGIKFDKTDLFRERSKYKSEIESTNILVPNFDMDITSIDDLEKVVKTNKGNMDKLESIIHSLDMLRDF